MCYRSGADKRARNGAASRAKVRKFLTRPPGYKACKGPVTDNPVYDLASPGSYGYLSIILTFVLFFGSCSALGPALCTIPVTPVTCKSASLVAPSVQLSGGSFRTWTTLPAESFDNGCTRAALTVKSIDAKICSTNSVSGTITLSCDVHHFSEGISPPFTHISNYAGTVETGATLPAGTFSGAGSFRTPVTQHVMPNVDDLDALTSVNIIGDTLINPNIGCHPIEYTNNTFIYDDSSGDYFLYSWWGTLLGDFTGLPVEERDTPIHINYSPGSPGAVVAYSAMAPQVAHQPRRIPTEFQFCHETSDPTNSHLVYFGYPVFSAPESSIQLGAYTLDAVDNSVARRQFSTSSLSTAMLTASVERIEDNFQTEIENGYLALEASDVRLTASIMVLNGVVTVMDLYRKASERIRTLGDSLGCDLSTFNTDPVDLYTTGVCYNGKSFSYWKEGNGMVFGPDDCSLSAGDSIAIGSGDKTMFFSSISVTFEDSPSGYHLSNEVPINHFDASSETSLLGRTGALEATDAAHDAAIAAAQADIVTVAGDLAASSDLITDLTAVSDGHGNQIVALASFQSTQGTQIASINDDLDTLTSSHNDLSATLTASTTSLSNNIDSLNTGLTALIVTANGNIASLNSEMDDIAAQVSEYNTVSDQNYNDLTSEVTELAAEVSDLEGRHEGLLEAAGNSIDSLGSAVGSLGDDIDDLWDGTSLSGLLPDGFFGGIFHSLHMVLTVVIGVVLAYVVYRLFSRK